MKNLFVASAFLSFFCGSKSIAVISVEGKDFEGKYLFTHSYNPKVKEYNDVVSKCFKMNSASAKVLQSYESCEKHSGRNTPLEKSVGECSRKDKASAYFFNSKEDCEAARSDTADGAAS